MIQEIRLLAASVEDGCTVRELCPDCLGGSKGEKSLTLSRDGDCVVFNCFRNNCKLRPGVIGGTGNLVRTKLTGEPRKKKFTKYEGELEPLSPEWEEYLERKIGWTDIHRSIGQPRYATSEHRVAFPIFGPMGVRRGWVLRSYTFGVEPKTLTRRDTEDEPCTSFYINAKPAAIGGEVIIVEDIPSAVRAATHLSSIAMNGNGLGQDAIAEIRAHHRKIVWAFDEDATTNAIRHHRKYGIYFDSSRVLPLQKDLKDLKEDELCSVLRSQ